MTHLMTTSAPTGLTVSGLTVRYGRAVALDKVDLEIPSGQVTALVGANGAGKSSAVLGTFGTVRASGRISLDGDADLDIAKICAALAAAAIADARRGEQLRDALSRRDVIGQAKGILMERGRITADQAFALLAGTSQRLNRKLTVVAEHLVDTGILLGSPDSPV